MGSIIYPFLSTGAQRFSTGCEIKEMLMAFETGYINLPILLKAYPSRNFFLEADFHLAISHGKECDVVSIKNVSLATGIQV
jgi:hypothetical protein